MSHTDPCRPPIPSFQQGIPRPSSVPRAGLRRLGMTRESEPRVIVDLHRRKFVRSLTMTLAALLFLFSCKGAEQRAIVVGSKNFTESVILGELIAQRLEVNGCKVERRLNMGG